MCSHKPVWIYRDKRKREFEFLNVLFFEGYVLELNWKIYCLLFNLYELTSWNDYVIHVEGAMI